MTNSKQILTEQFNEKYESTTNNIWNQILNVASAHSQIVRSGNSPEVAELINTLQFMQLSALDMMVMIKGLINSRNSFELLFFARSAGTILTEFNEDRNGITGKSFQSLCTAAGADDKEIEQLNTIRKKLKTIFILHEKKFREVRNTLHSHREHDTLAQIDLLSSLDPLEIKHILDSVLDWINELNAFLIPILSRKLTK